MSLAWLPNAISLLRIVLVPPILMLVLGGNFTLALLLFFVAGFSDHRIGPVLGLEAHGFPLNPQLTDRPIVVEDIEGTFRNPPLHDDNDERSSSSSSSSDVKGINREDIDDGLLE